MCLHTLVFVNSGIGTLMTDFVYVDTHSFDNIELKWKIKAVI